MTTTSPTPAVDLYTYGQSSTSDSWEISAWDAGQTSTMYWTPENVRVASDGDIELVLDRAPDGAARPYEGGEIRSNEAATTGTWSWTAQAPVMAPGAVFGLFTYKEDWATQPWVEFDFEFVGADTTKVQLNIHMEDAFGRHIELTPEAAARATVPLGFDAAQGMHTYEVCVTPTDATFYVDGQAIGCFTAADMPGGVWALGPMKSYANLWTVAPAQEAWAGVWQDPGYDLVARIEAVDIRSGSYGSTYVAPFAPQEDGPVAEGFVAPEGSIVGTALDDALMGTAAGDILFGLDGHDRLDGLGGADALYGGTGDDVYLVDSTQDVVVELADAGQDSVLSWVDWTLAEHVEAVFLQGKAGLFATGNAQANHLVGNAGNNTLTGLDGADTIEGGAGRDVLIGGQGTDRLVGGSGWDVFRFTAGDGTDTVVDFDTKAKEVLEFNGMGGLAGIYGEAGGTRVVLANGEGVFLEGVAVGALKAGHFKVDGLAPSRLPTASTTMTLAEVSAEGGDFGSVQTRDAKGKKGVLYASGVAGDRAQADSVWNEQGHARESVFVRTLDVLEGRGNSAHAWAGQEVPEPGFFGNMGGVASSGLEDLAQGGGIFDSYVPEAPGALLW